MVETPVFQGFMYLASFGNAIYQSCIHRTYALATKNQINLMIFGAHCAPKIIK
jgi:hypothetical protein